MRSGSHERMIRAVHEVHDICRRLGGDRLHAAHGATASAGWQLWKAMRSKNACKTCALGMGGQRGGMVNEVGHFPEVCKKSLQAMVADMQGGITPEFFARYSHRRSCRRSRRASWNACGRLVDAALRRAGRHALSRRSPGTTRSTASPTSSRRAGPDETSGTSAAARRNEAGFLLQLFARLYGTNNVNNC